MAKFVYRMQSILDIKYKMEEQEKEAYLAANTKLNEENRKLQELLLRRAGYEKKAKDLASGVIDVLAINENRHAIETMKSLIRDQMMKVQVAQKNVELARKKLNEVMMERKAHEKLKEKAFEDFKMELAFEEMKEIDQLVSFTYNDNQSEEEDD